MCVEPEEWGKLFLAAVEVLIREVQSIGNGQLLLQAVAVRQGGVEVREALIETAPGNGVNVYCVVPVVCRYTIVETWQVIKPISNKSYLKSCL